MLAPNILVQGRYKIVGPLGQGGMGAVYEAIDQRLKARVALKQLRLSSETQLVSSLPRIRRAFEREAQILAGLHHPALPVVHDYFTEGDAHFLVMQYIPGNDLAARLSQRGAPFPVDDVLNWSYELLDVVDYLHSQQPPIIHRDIKPANLKHSRGSIMLLDFGLAKGAPEVQSHLTGLNSLIIGYTPFYAPPEQMEGRSTDARSDLYAIGATLYDLLTNTRPTAAIERMHALVNRQPDPLRPIHEHNPQVGSALNAMVHHAMALGINDRPASAAEMLVELRAAAPLHQDMPVSYTSQFVTPTSPAMPATTGEQRTPASPTRGAGSASGSRRPIYLTIALLLLLIVTVVPIWIAEQDKTNGRETPTNNLSESTPVALSTAPVIPTSIAAEPTVPSTSPLQLPSPSPLSLSTLTTQDTPELHFFSRLSAIEEIVIIEGAIWALTKEGLVRVNTDGSFELVEAISCKECNALIIAPDGSIWIGDYDIVQLVPNADPIIHNQDDGGYIGLVNRLFVDSDGSIWSGGAYGLKRLSGPTTTPLPPVNAAQVKGDVRAFLRTSKGILWVGLTDRVMVWNGEAWLSFGTQQGLTKALDLAEGPDGTIWAAAGDKGLLRFDGKERWQHVSVLTENDDISTVVVIDGDLWVAGKGCLARSTDGGKTWQNMDPSSFAQNNIITSIASSSDGTIWIGSYNGIAYFEPAK